MNGIDELIARLDPGCFTCRLLANRTNERFYYLLDHHVAQAHPDGRVSSLCSDCSVIHREGPWSGPWGLEHRKSLASHLNSHHDWPPALAWLFDGMG